MTLPQSFPNFEALPVEIRLTIWKTIALTPRTLELYVQQVRYTIYLHCQNPIPALLHVCNESREEGLKYYSVLELKRWPPREVQDEVASPSWVTKRPPARIYISYERDTLYFCRSNPVLGMWQFLRSLELKRGFMPMTMAFDLDLGVYGGQKNGRRMDDVSALDRMPTSHRNIHSCATG